MSWFFIFHDESHNEWGGREKKSKIIRRDSEVRGEKKQRQREWARNKKKKAKSHT
jgi:hypothetical protein